MKPSERIPLFRPTYDVDSVIDRVRETLNVGWTGMGGLTEELEMRWRKEFGGANTLFLNSATAGLHLALEALKRNLCWQDDDEVISTPLTFVSTNHAILQSRLKPVFADVDEYLCLSPESIESRISNRTKAVIFVGLGGNGGHLPEVAELCFAKNLSLIVDAAHMAGSVIQGYDFYSAPAATIFSFQAVKNMPTADSGMLVMKDDEAADVARRLSWLGIDKSTYERQSSKGYSWEYDVSEVGYKYNGNALMAAVALAQMDKLRDDNAHRRFISEMYARELAEYRGIHVVQTEPRTTSSRHLFQVRVPDRTSVMQKLKDSGIDTGVHYVSNTAYRMYSHMSGDCPEAEKASKEILSLPLGLHMDSESVKVVCQQLGEIAGWHDRS